MSSSRLTLFEIGKRKRAIFEEEEEEAEMEESSFLKKKKTELSSNHSSKNYRIPSNFVEDDFNGEVDSSMKPFQFAENSPSKYQSSFRQLSPSSQEHMDDDLLLSSSFEKQRLDYVQKQMEKFNIFKNSGISTSYPIEKLNVQQLNLGSNNSIEENLSSSSASGIYQKKNELLRQMHFEKIHRNFNSFLNF